MKSRNITTIIAEGTDGVGKTELIYQLFKIYNYRYMVYHRGELSNLFYALKYNRPFAVTQNGLPFLHILLTCDKTELATRIKLRGERLKQSTSEIKEELSKIDDQDEFIKLAQAMSDDYHIIIVDTTGLSIEEVGLKVAKRINMYIESLEDDNTISEWNKTYKESCDKLSLSFTSKDNQPYINNVPFMSELTCQNGVYERFDNRDYPDNLIFAMNYSINESDINKIIKTDDFAYIINSKIKRRPEVYDYYGAFIKHNKSCLVSDNDLIPYDVLLKRQSRQFGNDFIKTLAKAKATVYTARDLAHLKMQTARLYEAILAKQIVFVDGMSDYDCDILKQIHKDKSIIDMLYTTPYEICDAYDIIINDKCLYHTIIDAQTKWYKNLIKLKGGKF